MAEPVDQFALARKRAQQAATVSNQSQKGALERRFAQLGSMDSGARIKLEQQVDEQTARQLSDANEGINAQEQQEMLRRSEIKEGRDFSRSEREASQGFASGEAEKGRVFATSERLGSQGFASAEAGKGREFATSERLGGQSFASGEAAMGRRFATSERLGGQEYAAAEAGKGRDFANQQMWANQAFAASEAGKGRDFQNQQMWSGQAFADKQAQKGMDFAQAQQQKQQQFAHNQAGLDRAARENEFNKQMAAQAEQFAKTFGEEHEVNEANIAFNRQMLGDESAIPGLLKSRYGIDWSNRNQQQAAQEPYRGESGRGGGDY